MTLAVFFPALMGVGILVSGAVLLSDYVRRLLPSRGRHRLHRITVGAYGVVASAAQAAGMAVTIPDLVSRERRPRWVYAAATLASLLAALLVVTSTMAAHADVRGVFYRSGWMVAVAVGVGGALIATAGVLAAITALYRRLPRPFAWIVRRSPVGRLYIPHRLDEPLAVAARDQGART